MLIPAVKQEYWARARELTAKHPENLCYAIGLHPYWSSEHPQSAIAELEKVIQEKPKGLVAIGECGLNAVAAPELMKRQIQLLEAQLKLALQYQLPVLLHVRKAHPELQALLKRYQGLRGVIHGFSGSYELAKSYLQLGMKLGVGGVMTYPRANKTRQAMQQLPLEALVLETDAPDMPICGRQGQRNSPEYLPEILASLVELRSEPQEQVQSQLWENSLALFSTDH